MKNILVFTPNCLELNKNGYLEGFHVEFDHCEAYYVTNPKILKRPKDVIGVSTRDPEKARFNRSKGLILDSVGGNIMPVNRGECVRILYNYDCFRISSLIPHENEYGVHFKLLIDRLKSVGASVEENGKKSFFNRFITLVNVILLIFENNYGKMLLYSATLAHFREDLNNLKIFTLQRESTKTGNYVLSKIIDLIIGYFILCLFIENEQIIVQFISSVSREIISSLKELLTYLMGSPIGLKLNYSFNRSLGTFFFYHISLWRIFLETIQPFIREYFIRLFLVIGTCGVSYQIAMLSDVICIATFHVYCIYVYAARLIFLQLKGLLSLWRLFIGRKFNPLRQRVDSYQYSQNQLFIGTLGFTILLFLLPTTTMYYTVFVIFRLTILIIEKSLEKLRNFLHCLPIFVVVLWLLRSPHLAGPVYIKWRKERHLEADLQLLPLTSAVKKFSLKTTNHSMKEWPSFGTIFHRIFTGTLI